MATYKGIRGHTIRTVAGDPSVLAVGDIWYNSSLTKIRVAKTTAAAWASGGNMTTGRGDGATASGAPSTAAQIMAGENPRTGKTEQYDGSSWTEVGDMGSGRNSARGAGTQTAALAFGGTPSPSNPVGFSEEWNGTSWAEGNDLNTHRYMGQGCGTQTAGLGSGGYQAAPAVANVPTMTEEYNGTSWAEGGTLNAAKNTGQGFGIQTAAIVTGPSDTPTTEQYDGSSWTEIADLNNARHNVAAGGIVTIGLVMGGPGGHTELWDGSAWTETSNMSSGRAPNYGSSGGSNTAGYVCGGPAAAPGNATEEFTGESTDAATVTSS